MDVQNELICRTADGTETVLLKDCGSGPIFICGDYIFYEKGYYSWGVCHLDGTSATSYSETDILAVDIEQNTVIATNYTSEIFAITAEDGQISLAPAGASFIGIHGIRMYYGLGSENYMNIYSVRLDGLDTLSLGSITFSNSEMGMISIGDSLLKEDGIYVSVGFYGGTGNFFYNGGIYRIGYDKGIETLIDPAGTQQVNFPKIYIEETEETSTLYYYCGEGYSNVGFWDSWISEDVYGLNLETYAIEPKSFKLSNIGDIICLDGSVCTLLDNSGQYTEILSAELATQLGYADLGEHSADGEAFVSKLDIIEDTAYFTITKITQDPSASIGWRTGYRRDPMKTYMTQIGSGEVTLLNEY